MSQVTRPSLAGFQLKLPYCFPSPVFCHLSIFSGRSTGFPYLNKSEYIVRVCLCVLLGALCSRHIWLSHAASSLTFSNIVRLCSLGSVADKVLFFILLFVVFIQELPFLTFYFFPWSISRLHKFITWFHIFFFLSGLIKDCENLPAASEPTVLRNKKIFWLLFLPLRLKQDSQRISENFSSSGAPGCAMFPPANCLISFVCVALEAQWTLGA